MVRDAVLITGGDGYLGSLVARRYLECTRRPVHLWVHASGADDLEIRRRHILSALSSAAAHGDALGRETPRVVVHGGDLIEPDPFSTVPSGEIGAIVHTAAVIRFSVDEATAQAVNVEGTAKLIDFARHCPWLETLGHLSTIYASGLRAGSIPESALDGDAGFANHYEASKWRAEALLLSESRDLPWRIVRVATAIAGDEGGAVAQQNAVHETLRLFFYGLMPLLPGRPETILYFVTGEFAARAVFALMEGSERHGIYHVAHGPEESATLGDLVEIAYEVFSRDPDFRERRVLKPHFTDREGFELMVQGISPFPGVLSRAVAALAPFARQLYVEKRIENGNLRRAMDTYRAPDPRELVRRVTEHLVSTRWGRTPGAHA